MDAVATRTERTVGVRPKHAAERRIVRLPNGETATLTFASPYGNTAKVRLPSGAYLCFRATELELVET